VNHPLNNFLSNVLLRPIDGMIVGLMGFFIASSSVRAFRMRNLDAAVLLISFVAVVIGMAPIFENATTIAIRQIVMDVFHAAGVRAMGIALTIGSFAYTVRLWLGLERAALGEVEIT
jgi:hypothetical protein